MAGLYSFVIVVLILVFLAGLAMFYQDFVVPALHRRRDEQARRDAIQARLDRQAEEDLQRHRERIERSLDELHES